MERLRWAVLGTGRIAARFAQGLRVSGTGRLQAVGSRDPERARSFAERHGAPDAGTYEEALENPEVDAAYIATPHHTHKELTIAAATAGKAILCEKPFALNLREAEEALEAVRRSGVFFMEAFMYRCHPQIALLRELIAEGAIGEPMLAHAEFGFDAPDDWEDFRAVPELGGGALMDVGTYCTSFASLVFQLPAESAEYAARRHPRGYDALGSGLLRFPGGRSATFATAVHLALSNRAIVFGRRGRIELDSPWTPGPEAALRLVRHEGTKEFRPHPVGGDLYAMEADAVARALPGVESPVMPWNDTLENARLLDALRRSAGLRLPADDWE